MKHTKGKWELGKSSSISMPFYIEVDGIEICRILDFSVQEELEANAKLIAAAPELLEALIAVTDSSLFNKLLVMQGRATGKTHFKKVYEEAKAIITKATI